MRGYQFSFNKFNDLVDYVCRFTNHHAARQWWIDLAEGGIEDGEGAGALQNRSIDPALGKPLVKTLAEFCNNPPQEACCYAIAVLCKIPGHLLGRLPKRQAEKFVRQTMKGAAVREEIHGS